MPTRRRKISTGSESSSSMALLGLSLFIMLLAFFIVINAISPFKDTRVKPVLQSLEQTFTTRITSPQDRQPSQMASSEESSSEGDTLDRLQALFRAQIPGHKATVDKKTGVMHVELPFDVFEKAVMTLGQNSESPDAAELQKDFFLPALIALIRNDKAHMPYRMDIMLGVEENPALLQNQSPQRVAELNRRLSNIADLIEKAGLKRKFVSIGIKKGKADTVELFFLPHIPFNPMAESTDYEQQAPRE